MHTDGSQLEVTDIVGSCLSAKFLDSQNLGMVTIGLKREHQSSMLLRLHFWDNTPKRQDGVLCLPVQELVCLHALHPHKGVLSLTDLVSSSFRQSGGEL